MNVNDRTVERDPWADYDAWESKHEEKGGKPNPGTPPDKRLTSNRPPAKGKPSKPAK